jgi:hypothetical protein
MLWHILDELLQGPAVNRVGDIFLPFILPKHVHIQYVVHAVPFSRKINHCSNQTACIHLLSKPEEAPNGIQSVYTHSFIFFIHTTFRFRTVQGNKFEVSGVNICTLSCCSGFC